MKTIQHPDFQQLAVFSDELRRLSGETSADAWPTGPLAHCQRVGLFRWFCGAEWGGMEWADADLLRAYVEIARGCLTTAFVLTQRTAAVSRLERSNNEELKRRLMPDFAAGELFATVGISHLTTSRQHQGQPALRAEPADHGFLLNGYTPWVTGASHADWFVVGASAATSEKQLLAAVPAHSVGISVPSPQNLLALTGSHTGAVQFENVFVPEDCLLAGPIENVMSSGIGGRTGGLQTSALALGLTRAALDYIAAQAEQRAELHESLTSLEKNWTRLLEQMIELAESNDPCSIAASANTLETRSFDNESLRRDANDLVLRSTHAALATAKGAGFVASHPVARWCREALFFLVWSCPQKVVTANLCQFAGIGV